MDEVIELRYDLYSLPTAQHRAGLAGLLVLLESLRRRRTGPLPDVEMTDQGGVWLRLTLPAIQTLLNELYDASWQPRERNEKPTGKKFVRNVTVVEGEGGKRRYGYEQLAPRAAFLEAFSVPAPWQRLWSDAVWSTLRGITKARKPYEERVAGQAVSEAAHTWAELGDWVSQRALGRTFSEDISSSLFIGAQALNAERVPFRGTADQNLLLHFWPVVMSVYVPEEVDRDGERKHQGYVLAVPDVQDLAGFVAEFPRLLAQLGDAVARVHPREALISLPQEGALEYLHHLLALAATKGARGDISFTVAGVEVYHLQKRGNTIRVLGSGRVPAEEHLVSRYDGYRGLCWHPLARRQVVLNLLGGQPWFHGFDRLFAMHDRDLFFPRRTGRQDRDQRLDQEAGRFAHDARQLLDLVMGDAAQGG